MITCSVCGGLNDPNNAVCVHCGSDLIDESEAISFYEDRDDYSDSSTDDSNDYMDDSSDYIDDYDDYEDDY